MTRTIPSFDWRRAKQVVRNGIVRVCQVLARIGLRVARCAAPLASAVFFCLLAVAGKWGSRQRSGAGWQPPRTASGPYDAW